MLFKYEHAARNWAHQQRKWFGRETKIIKLKSETPEGAKWAVWSLGKLATMKN